jgi:hypothetical protein
MMYDYLTKDENEVYDDNYNDWLKIIIIYIYIFKIATIHEYFNFLIKKKLKKTNKLIFFNKEIWINNNNKNKNQYLWIN